MSRNSLIKKAGASVFRAKLTQPFRTALGQHDCLENVLFWVELKGGIRGYGEAAVASHITGETVSETLQNLKKTAAQLAGSDASDCLGLSLKFRERFKKNKCAQAALEMALLDALARELRIPLWKFFGTQPELLRTDMTVVLGTPDEAEDSARKIYQRGIRSLKVKIGKDLGEDLERVRRIQKAAGRSAIYLDANQGFSAEETLWFLKELTRLKIKPELIEQPVPKADWEGLKKVTRESGVMVLADESASSLSDVTRIIRGKYAHAVNIKLMKFGFLEAREAALLARAAGLKLMIGAMMESPLAITAAAHLAAGLGGFQFVDLDTPFFIKEKVMKGSYLSSAGVYDMQKVKTGIGITPLR